MKTKLPTSVVEGPMGLKMPEALARRIESLAKTLPSDFTYRRLARQSDEFQLDDGERTDVSLITTDALDREGEVILPSGIDWSGYNRVVTFSHRYDQLPVGSNWWMRSRGSGLIAKTHYPAKPADWGDSPWMPSAVLHLMQQPVPTCTGKSIGFLPLNIREATPAERARRPELAGVPIIDKAAGIEYAVAPVPCNPEAQMQAVAKGQAMGLLDDSLAELFLDQARPTSMGASSALDLNQEGLAFATQLIECGDVDFTDAWSFDALDDSDLLGDPNDWTRYRRCFLATDRVSDVAAREHFRLPFARLRPGGIKLSPRALKLARDRTDATHEVRAAAGRLLALFEAHQTAGKTIAFVRPATIAVALRSQLAAQRDLFRREVQQQIREVFCAATGRVS